MRKDTHGHVFTLCETFPRLWSFSWAVTFDPWPGGDKPVRGQSTRLAANGDYAIKLLVNLSARNRSKCHERLFEGARPCASGDEGGRELQLSLEDELGLMISWGNYPDMASTEVSEDAHFPQVMRSWRPDRTGTGSGLRHDLRLIRGDQCGAQEAR